MKYILPQNHKTKSYSHIFISVTVLFLIVLSSDARAQGNLLINPKRVIFDGTKRSQEISLANIGKDSATYVVSFVQNRMTDDGNFEPIAQPDSGQNFADKYLRIFPRSVTLGPNEAQVIKVQVNQYNKLQSGEYRSHLYFRAVPNVSPLGEDSAKKDTSNVSVRLTAIFGISIPIIIRSGESDTRVNLSNLQLENHSGNTPALNVRFNRTGNMSVYGDLSVDHVSNQGKVTRVGLIKGISVYTPNKVRNISIKLDKNAEVNYRSGKLQVNYFAPAEEKPEKLASAVLSLN
jgi:P pilus assembly chaperone PapD